MAYESLYGIPSPWEQTGQVCATIANAQAPKKDRTPWTAADFMPRRPQKRKATAADTERIIAGVKRRAKCRRPDN